MESLACMFRHRAGRAGAGAGAGAGGWKHSQKQADLQLPPQAPASDRPDRIQCISILVCILDVHMIELQRLQQLVVLQAPNNISQALLGTACLWPASTVEASGRMC